MGNHDCPTCGVPLQGVAAGCGRHLCPIDGYVVTLGQTAVQLDRPMRLIWQPGEFGRWHVTEPGQVDAQRPARVAERILGTDCVVSTHYAPDRDRSAHWDRQAGLRLVDADAPGDQDAWLVNEWLTYRQCAACAIRIPDVPEHRVPTKWTPRRAWASRDAASIAAARFRSAKDHIPQAVCPATNATRRRQPQVASLFVLSVE